MDALYISYDGLLEPLGRSQVLSYLFPVAANGIRLEVLSFEKPSDMCDEGRRKELEQELHNAGIGWARLVYHRRPRILSTALDIALGTWTALRIAHAKKIRVVHARGYVPALIALAVKSLAGARLIFDMRGFWPEERVDLGIFRENGCLFHLSKWFEKLFLRNSDQIVVLTDRAKEILESSSHLQQPAVSVKVIPCCVDLTRFSHREANAVLSDKHGLNGRPVIGNLGAVSGRYLVPEMFRFVVRLREYVPALRFVYLTYQDPELLLSIAIEEGLAPECLVVAKATPEEVPDWLSVFHYGLFFPKPSYSARAMCPTKLGELLAAGVPVVTNSGVGDVQNIVEKEGVGIVLTGFSNEELTSAAEKIATTIPVSPDLRQACRDAAKSHFALSLGTERYLSIYKSLLDAAGQKTSPRTAMTQGN